MRCLWNEYSTKDGHKYWYNVNTKKSVWEMPEEYKDYLRRKEIIERTNTELSSKNMTSSRSSRKPYPSPQMKSSSSSYRKSSSLTPTTISPAITQLTRPILSKSEADIEFYSLFDEYRIPSGMQWPDVISMVQKDPRWNLLSNISDKKEAFDDYCKLAIGREREEEKRQLEEARKKYRRLLENTPEIKSHMKFIDIEKLLGTKTEYIIIIIIC